MRPPANWAKPGPVSPLARPPDRAAQNGHSSHAQRTSSCPPSFALSRAIRRSPAPPCPGTARPASHRKSGKACFAATRSVQGSGRNPDWVQERSAPDHRRRRNLSRTRVRRSALPRSDLRKPVCDGCGDRTGLEAGLGCEVEVGAVDVGISKTGTNTKRQFVYVIQAAVPDPRPAICGQGRCAATG